VGDRASLKRYWVKIKSKLKVETNRTEVDENISKLKIGK
jgi:hypothetical protein